MNVQQTRQVIALYEIRPGQDHIQRTGVFTSAAGVSSAQIHAQQV